MQKHHRRMKTLYLTLVIALATGCLACRAQHELIIEVRGVPEARGQVRAALYNSQESFLSFDGVLLSGSAPIQGDAAEVRLQNVPAGRYALALFHDENDNGKLDKNFLGIPREAVAFSKASMRTFGPPRYEECEFEVNGPTRVPVLFK